MAPSLHVFSRDTPNDGDSNKITPVIIAGIAVAAAAFLGVCLWLGIRTYRKRSLKQRENGRQGAFLTVKGVMPESDEKAPTPRPAPGGLASQFSRTQLTASIVMPNQTIVRPDATKDEIIRFHIASGTMTRPFSLARPEGLAPPKAPGAASRPVSTVSFSSAGPPSRQSFFGIGSRPMSTASSVSVTSTFAGVEGRKVRQLFAPVLPDEMVLSLGEKVTVVQSFDDGWCIVGRDSMLKPGDVEMGAVPAWCFIKPVKGLKASRPMRTTSLGVSVQMDGGPGFSSRDELISWSNF
ncbi:hypothetical protein BC834DRAFT_923465 [Gloeopeniophorella convolvens]|nr:hypothetical protein BC834DRAFT_923465 [Gloeopeniophorella convolvens]